MPLDAAGKWSFGTDAELFLTLRGTSVGGDTGLTGLRTQYKLGYEVNDNLSLSAIYLRQQDFRDNRPDRVGPLDWGRIQFLTSCAADCGAK